MVNHILFIEIMVWIHNIKFKLIGSYNCPDITYSVGGRFAELACLENGLMKDYSFVELGKLYQIKSAMTWSGIDSVQYPISIVLYNPQRI